MRHWSSKPYFQTLRGRLAITSGHYFQRAIFPLPPRDRIPDDRSATAKLADCCGIDHLVLVSTPTRCHWLSRARVIRRWANMNSEEASFSSVSRQIETFRKSGVRASKYLLVHNRERPV